MRRITNQLKRQYYLHDGEFEHGPYTIEELRTKNLSPTSLIWHSMLKEWSTVADVPEVAAQLNTPETETTDPYSRTTASTYAHSSSPGRENIHLPKKSYKSFVGGGLVITITMVIWFIATSC